MSEGDVQDCGIGWGKSRRPFSLAARCDSTISGPSPREAGVQASPEKNKVKAERVEQAFRPAVKLLKNAGFSH
jgi:hypothetical protein